MTKNKELETFTLITDSTICPPVRFRKIEVSAARTEDLLKNFTQTTPCHLCDALNPIFQVSRSNINVEPMAFMCKSCFDKQGVGILVRTNTGPWFMLGKAEFVGRIKPHQIKTED